MTSIERPYHGPKTIRGYVPVADTRDRILEFVDADIDLRSLAAELGITAESMRRIARGRTRFVSARLADAIASVDLEEAADRHLTTRPYLDEATLEQLTKGALTHSISRVDKPLYARALHTRGWTKYRIRRELRMSGASVNRVLSTKGAAA